MSALERATCSVWVWAQQWQTCVLCDAGEAMGSVGLQLSTQNLAAAFASGKSGVVCPSIPEQWVYWVSKGTSETEMESCLFHGY